MLVDLVVDDDGTYWRRRVDLPAPPERGDAVLVLTAPDVVAVVVGNATPFEDDGTVASALMRTSQTPGPGRDDRLRRAGWRPLLDVLARPALLD